MRRTNTAFMVLIVIFVVVALVLMFRRGEEPAEDGTGEAGDIARRDDAATVDTGEETEDWAGRGTGTTTTDTTGTTTADTTGTADTTTTTDTTDTTGTTVTDTTGTTDTTGAADWVTGDTGTTTDRTTTDTTDTTGTTTTDTTDTAATTDTTTTDTTDETGTTGTGDTRTTDWITTGTGTTDTTGTTTTDTTDTTGTTTAWPGGTTGTREHVVVRGDTLAGIAKEYYGRETAWRVIYEANRDRLANPHKLKLKMRLRIPPAPPRRTTTTTTPAPTGTAAPGQRTYTVRKGETLSSIARKLYGAEGKWPRLMEANRERLNLERPEDLKEGHVLVVPKDGAAKAPREETTESIFR
jgi:nucleoid-associated protein YgaU